jgi:hypothetical protein
VPDLILTAAEWPASWQAPAARPAAADRVSASHLEPGRTIEGTVERIGGAAAFVRWDEGPPSFVHAADYPLLTVIGKNTNHAPTPHAPPAGHPLPRCERRGTKPRQRGGRAVRAREP